MYSLVNLLITATPLINKKSLSPSDNSSAARRQTVKIKKGRSESFGTPLFLLHYQYIPRKAQSQHIFPILCGVLFFGANALCLLCDFAQKGKVVTIICRKSANL